jgi:predicted dehydrogenase/threonine dehydrogenase-like Zn-dependent dehydrogenase
MKQLLQNLRTGETTVKEVPVPTPQDGEVLVRNMASLVSAGTERTLVEFAEKSLAGKARSRPDLVRQVLDKARREGLLTTIEAAFSRLAQPMPLGYSSAGVITAVGEGVSGLQKGQRVACAGGNYAVHAEYVSVPHSLLTPLPDTVGFEAASFTTLGAIAMHGFRLAETQLGERIAVVGLGLLGLLAAEIASAAGCHVLGIDLDPRRVSLANQMGFNAVLRTHAEDAAASFSRGRGCDAILICAGTSSNDPVELAGVLARDRARVVATGAVGLNLPRKIFFEKEITFINSRSYGPGRYDPSYEEGGHDYPIGYVRWTEGRNMEAFVDLLADGRVDVQPLITHRFPIEDAPKAYELITGKKDGFFLGVLLNYPEDQPVNEQSQLQPGRASNGSEPAFASTESEPQTAATSLTAKVQPFRSDVNINLGVLGAGAFATNVMLPAIKKTTGVNLSAVASASGLSASHAASRFGFDRTTSDENQIVRDPSINTVAIFTRHHLHASQVLAALDAGKHVFCEKPLALAPQELAEIEAKVEQLAQSPQSPILMTGFNRRFAPLATRLFDFFKNRHEPLFAHYRINAGYIPLSHWLHDPVQGGGRIIGEACHFIDFLTFLTGQTPMSVRTHALPDAGRYREDNVLITLSFSDGSIGQVSYLANGDKTFPKERVEVFSGGKVGVLEDFRLLETVSQGTRQVVRSRLRQDKGHQAEWKAFLDSITTSGSPPIHYDQMFGVMRATFAAVKSLRTRETVHINGGAIG